MTEQLTIVLPGDLIQRMRDSVAEGSYASTNHIIQEAVQMWAQRATAERVATIRRELDEAAASGDPRPLEEAFEEIAQLYRARRQARPG